MVDKGLAGADMGGPHVVAGRGVQPLARSFSARPISTNTVPPFSRLRLRGTTLRVNCGLEYSFKSALGEQHPSAASPSRGGLRIKDG
jgi:hypothetical protein